MDTKQTTIEKQRQRIVSYIKKYIRDNNLQEHDRLMSESCLSEKFHANRNTVRSALSVLKAQGIIYSRKGKGFFVSERPKPIVFEHNNALGFSEILNKGKREYTSEVISVQLRPPTPHEKKILKLHDGEQIYYLKQLRTKQGSHFAVCASVLPAKRVPDFENHLENFCGINNILMNAYHFPHPVCKWVQLTASLPTTEEVQLLGITENMPILKQENLFCIEGIGTIEYFIVRARGDAFRFSMEFQ